ncbi:TetR family transcriptional regulator [Streptomyces heliomycini]|uniref:TetR family transcriptional regulator n=1 Tax=Streptomyces heliomycini TaxID=284032 RepID=A0ABV5L4T4_9ACTN
MSHVGCCRLMAVDRDHVLRSAAALLTRRSTATMDEVAEAAGISRATLHRQFAGRDALVRALEALGIAGCEAALAAARTDEGPAADAVRRLVAGIEPHAPLLGAALLVVGLGAGLSCTVTAYVILSGVPKEQAGAASAVFETAYELGAALGIAVLGSIVTGVYRGFTGPAGTPAEAHESLGGAVEAASALPAHTAEPLLDAARQAFVDGLTLAAGTGAVVLLATAAASWFMLRDQRLDDGVPGE